MTPEDPRHGSTRGYHAGCRELCCRRAISRYEKGAKYRHASGIRWAIPAIGAQRRIQALMTLGWTSTDIAHAAGWEHRNYVMRILHGQKGKPCTWVERKTHARICDVFDRLCMTLPPHSPARARTRSLARKKGYVPPLGWDQIDDPGETPTGWEYRKRVVHNQYKDDHLDPVVVMRLLQGDRVVSTSAERAAALEQWVRDGGTEAELCRWHGWNPGRYSAGLRLVGGGAA